MVSKMAEDSITSYIIAAAIVIFAIVYYLRKPRRSRSSLPSPPGPKGLPIAGSLFSLNLKRLHVALCELGKQYGDVFTVNILGERILILNGIGAIREAYLDEKYKRVFAGRPPTFVGEYIFHQNKDVAFQTYNALFARQRKMTFKLLHYYGEGMGAAEKTVTEELRCVVETLKATNGKSLDLITDIILPSLINIINILLKGERWSYDDKRMERIVTFTYDSDRLLNPDVEEALRRFPFLRHLPFEAGKVWRKVQPAMHAFIDIPFTQVKATYKAGISRGMTDDMIAIQRENEKENGVCWPSDMNIKGMLTDFIIAGVMTTKVALSTFILQMLYRPDIFRKIQEEVDTVIGHERVPTFADMNTMPYTQAVIMENLRYNSHSPLAVPHSTTEDVEFRGYFIPKDTRVIGNLWQAHKDKRVWKKPDEFYPEHFLDEFGNLLRKEDPVFKSYIPFGLGKRQCVGLTFAKNRIFLYVTTLAQNFNFIPDEMGTLPPHDPTKHMPVVLLHPGPYQVCAVARDVMR